MSSSDTEALAQVQDLIDQLIPSAERFKKFPLKHISASTMMFILEDLFRDEMEEEEDDYSFFRRYYGGDDEEKSFNLSKRPQLQFDYENRSNAVLVANANPRQLREIERLIEIYDQPYDERLVVRRQTEPIKIRYSRASTIAAALKDAYRDLLSQRDAVFNSGEEDNNRVPVGSQYWSIIRYGGNGDGQPGTRKTEQVPARFDGALAIGVDEISNMIIVSASEEIFDSVVSLIRKLDEEARPQTTVAVHRVAGALNAEELQQALSEALGQPWLGGQPPAAQQPNANQAQNGENREQDRRRDGGERRDRGRDRRGDRRGR